MQLMSKVFLTYWAIFRLKYFKRLNLKYVVNVFLYPVDDCILGTSDKR